MIKKRQSNYELLRLLSMFLVLILHGFGVALGLPSKTDFLSSPLSATIRVLLESLSLVCVNVFVLISGWFGIKPNAKSFLGFIFQCLFFSIGITILAPQIGIGEPLKLRDVGNMLFFGKYYYWFVKCYICLYVLSPVLNAFIENARQNVFLMILVCLLIIQTLYGWSGTMGDFDRGYSVLSFVVLYLLARYVRLYGGSIFRQNKWIDFSVYLSFSIFVSALFILSILFGYAKIASHLLVFINPLVIIASVFLLLFFSKLNIQNDSINYLSRSAFAVYLFHLNIKIWDSFLYTCYNTFSAHSGLIGFLMLIGILLLVYIIALLIDQIRLLCWKPFGERLERFIKKSYSSFNASSIINR